MLYLSLITIGICVEYVGMYYLFPYLLSQKTFRFDKEQIKSIGILIMLSLISYGIYYFIPNEDIANRFLHGISGGFVSLIAVFYATKDLQKFNGFIVNKFQYALIGFLIVMSLGIVNEIFECYLQNTFAIIAAATINDTWFDLISNAGGALLALIITIPLLKRA